MPKTPDNSYLAGQLLLAMPGLADPRFHKAVIYICAHDANGAMGLVVNNILPGMELGQLLQQMNLGPAGHTRPPVPRETPVFSGGPVESARGFVLHSTDFLLPDTVRVDDRFSVTGTVDALRAIASGKGPSQLLFALGYSGWTAGQLEQELQQNSWLNVDADPNLIFHASPEEKWGLAIAKLGIDPANLSGVGGRA